MTIPPIIEVTLLPDGKMTYRLRTSLLDTKAYGVLLATLARQIGTMMQHEGGLDHRIVTAEILHYLTLEIDQPTQEEGPLHLLQ